MSNDKKVMTELYKNFYISLVNTCHSRGLSRDDSEDVVSEAFSRFWKEMTTLRELSMNQQKAWLYKAAFNICNEKLRDLKKIADNEELEATPDPRDEIGTFLEDKTFAELVKTLESKLNDTEKEALRVLFKVNKGKTYREIAEEENLNISTLTSMTSRVRKKASVILSDLLSTYK